MVRAQLKVEGYRQGLIIGLDPGPTGSVWIRNSRGRVVQAAREQVRGVEGEELWSPNLDDIQALKDAEIDLSEKHPQAFDHRSTAPSAIEDKRVIEALDAAGQPQLTADDAKVIVPVLSPAEIESRRSSKTDTQVTVPSSRASPATPFIYLPPTPALPAPGTPGLEVQQPALPPIPEEDEPNTLKESSRPTGSLLKLEDAPLQLTQPPSTSTTSRVGQGVKRSSDVSQEVLREASKIPSSSARGQKRDAEIQPHALQQQIQSEPSQAQQQQKSSVMHSALLAYCKQCGTSNSTSASQEECPRCGSAEFVDDPVLVKNWFDEVEEHEAMHQTKEFVFDPYYKRWLDRWPDDSGRFDLPRDDYLEESLHSEAFITGVGQVFSQLPEGAPVDTPCLWSVANKTNKNSQWEWQKLFESIDLDEDVVTESMKPGDSPGDETQWAFVRHGKGTSRKVRPQQQQPEHRFLHRHGRHCVHVTGWDGSAPELQPAFCNSHFATAYLLWCDAVAQGQQGCNEEQLEEINHDINDLKQNEFYDVLTVHVAPTTPVFNVCNVQAEQLFQAESSGDEDEAETPGRAAKQALKREIPWQSIADHEWSEFVQALRDEWKEWEMWSSCQPVELKENEVDPKLILKSRVCYRWKPKDGGKWFKAKARIVLQGYRDPHLPLLTRDSPVLSKTCFILIVQWAASNQVSIFNADCKSAFLQGLPDDERPTAIYMRPPQDGISLEVNPKWQSKRYVYKLTAPVYGQANAPRRWFLYVVQVLTGKHWAQHTLDPCCFLQRVDNQVVALLGLHVDDIITCCLPGYEHLLDEVKTSFVWGSEWEKDDFIFVGRRLQKQSDGGFTLDQTHYVADIMKTKITKDPEEKLMNHPELVTEFRSGIGSLQWLAGTTRGDLSSYVSLLQKKHDELKVADLIQVNQVLKYVKATATSYFRIFPVKLSNCFFVAYGDSGFANAPNNKSQGGYVVLLTDKQALESEQPASLWDWKSYRHQRILRSTLAAEAASLDKAQDMGHFMACAFTEMTNPQFRANQGLPDYEVVPITDARSLWDAVHRLSTTFSEKRVELDVAGLRSSCRNLRWVPTEKQHADALTKMHSKLRNDFRVWMQSPSVTLVDSKSAYDGDDNSKWR